MTQASDDLSTTAGFKKLMQADGDATGTIRIPLEVGSLYRGQIRGALAQCELAFDLDEFKWAESKGFFESSFLIKARGRAAELKRLARTVEGWVDE